MNDRDAYVEKVKVKLDEWNAEIAVLSAKADLAAANAKAEYIAHIQALEKQRDDARKKLSDLQSAGENAWSDVRRGMEAAWDNMNSALRDASSRFK